MAADFQPSDRTTSRWLCHEMKNAGLCAPLISTTGGCKSNCGAASAAGATAAPAPPADKDEDDVKGPPPVMPAAAHAAGLAMPAFIIAAATFSRCAPSSTGAGWLTATETKALAPNVNVEPVAPGGSLGNLKEDLGPSVPSVLTGTSLAVVPWFSASVPRTKSAFFGLMQYSSTLILCSLLTPCRVRKSATFGGVSRLLENKE